MPGWYSSIVYLSGVAFSRASAQKWGSTGFLQSCGMSPPRQYFLQTSVALSYEAYGSEVNKTTGFRTCRFPLFFLQTERGLSFFFFWNFFECASTRNFLKCATTWISNSRTHIILRASFHALMSAACYSHGSSNMLLPFFFWCRGALSLKVGVNTESFIAPLKLIEIICCTGKLLWRILRYAWCNHQLLQV